MDNRESKKFFFFLILFFVSLLLYTLDNLGWITKGKGLVQKPFLFLERPIYSAHQSISHSVKQLSSQTESEQIIQLQVQLRQLAIEQNQLSTCLEENEHLKKLLGAPLPSKWKFQLARVVGLTENMRIDLGTKDGAKEGMVVVVENIYVGRLISVGENNSLAQLPTDTNSKIPVVVKKPGSEGIQARGLLVGQPEGKLILEKVLSEEDIRQGDLVVASGEEGYLPDLVIGQIKEVIKGSAEIYQKAIVSPLVDYSSLRFVFLVIQ